MSNYPALAKGDTVGLKDASGKVVGHAIVLSLGWFHQIEVQDIKTGLISKVYRSDLWKGRRRRDYCKKGHELTPDNIYIWKGKPTSRECKTCRNTTNSRYRKRRLEYATHAR